MVTFGWCRVPSDMFLAILLMDGERNIRLVQRTSGSFARRLTQTLQPTPHLCSEAHHRAPTSASPTKTAKNHPFPISEAHHSSPSYASPTRNPQNLAFSVSEAHHRAPTSASPAENAMNLHISACEADGRDCRRASQSWRTGTRHIKRCGPAHNQTCLLLTGSRHVWLYG